jgi:hypothetical protein
LWGGISDRGKYLETIAEVSAEGKHQFIYLKKELKECRQDIDNSIIYNEGSWDREVPLTCGGDQRNATLILPSRANPEPGLHFFKLDLERETVVSQLINLKDRVGEPCECAENEDCDDGSPCTTDSCQEALCQYVAVCDIYYCANASPDKADWKCVKNDKLSVVCNSTKDTVCAKNICNPKTGSCEMTSVVSDGAPCEADKEFCTKKDQCQDGKCVAGNWDYNDPSCQCKKDADCLKFDANVLSTRSLLSSAHQQMTPLAPKTSAIPRRGNVK